MGGLELKLERIRSGCGFSHVCSLEEKDKSASQQIASLQAELKQVEAAAEAKFRQEVLQREQQSLQRGQKFQEVVQKSSSLEQELRRQRELYQQREDSLKKKVEERMKLIEGQLKKKEQDYNQARYVGV